MEEDDQSESSGDWQLYIPKHIEQQPFNKKSPSTKYK